MNENVTPDEALISFSAGAAFHAAVASTATIVRTSTGP